MITRTQLRDKIETILANNEYKRHYYDEDGNITGAASANGNIDSDAIDSLLDGYFGDTTYSESQNATIVLVESTYTRTKPEYASMSADELTDVLATGIDITEEVTQEHYNDIPSDDDLAIAVAAGFDTSRVEEPTVTYDADTHGAPSGAGVQALSFSIDSQGDFFGDLNTFALVGAAVYELANDRVAAREAALQATIDDLKTQLQTLGINVT